MAVGLSTRIAPVARKEILILLFPMLVEKREAPALTCLVGLGLPYGTGAIGKTVKMMSLKFQYPAPST